MRVAAGGALFGQSVNDRFRGSRRIPKVLVTGKIHANDMRIRR